MRRDFGSVFAASGSVSKLPEHLSKHITYISTSSGGCALPSSVNNKEINSINNTHQNSREMRAGTILFRRCGALKFNLLIAFPFQGDRFLSAQDKCRAFPMWSITSCQEASKQHVIHSRSFYLLRWHAKKPLATITISTLPSSWHGSREGWTLIKSSGEPQHPVEEASQSPSHSRITDEDAVQELEQSNQTVTTTKNSETRRM